VKTFRGSSIVSTPGAIGEARVAFFIGKAPDHSKRDNCGS
jgi:hypothetical protein